MDHPFSRRDAARLLGATVAAPLLGGTMPDICALTAVEMAALIRHKKLSAREAMTAHLKQIERVNPQVNAIVTLVADQAMENARRADEAQARGQVPGPLHGLPIAIKDLVATAGIRTTMGSRLFKDFVPDYDAIHVERIKKAGAILVGKTNTPEFGAGSQTFNEVFGKTRNPWDLTKTCGGSSGGAAVSLTTNMVPLADGSDNGGSLRNPAAFSNVIGFRVAPGRVPDAAPGSPSWSTMSVSGPMGRTVSDVALLLSVMAGPDPRCPISITEPGSGFTGSLNRNFKDVRVAWFRDFGGIPFDPRIRQAVNAQRKAFESLGCIVEEAEPDLSGGDESYETLRLWSYASTYGADARRHPELFKDTILEAVELGSKLTAADIARANTQHGRVWDQMRRFQERYEYFIVPSTQVPPFDVNEPWVKEINGIRMRTYIEWMKCCWMVTITECPSISMPCGFTPEGLPVGLQIVGRHRDELNTLRMAYAFEQATGFGKKRPPLAG
jgi:amidase